MLVAEGLLWRRRFWLLSLSKLLCPKRLRITADRLHRFAYVPAQIAALRLLVTTLLLSRAQARCGGLSGWNRSSSGTFTLPCSVSDDCARLAGGVAVAQAAAASNAYVFQRVAVVRLPATTRSTDLGSGLGRGASTEWQTV